MTAPCRVDLPFPACSLRNTLATAQQGNIDSVLKDLKTCARRLQAAFASHQVELQVLEKLYYKGNNQHRTALFWRRVADVRRYGKRLEDLKVHEHLESIRLSFWGEASERSAKALKGAWTRVPDIASVLHALERFRSCLVFVDSMEEHLMKAHNHFNLDLQTGAFLQLILTLIAITSRMAILLTEIGPALAKSWEACYRLFEILTPDRPSQAPKHLGGKYKASDPRNITVSNLPRRFLSTPRFNRDLGEDIGSVMHKETLKPDGDAWEQAMKVASAKERTEGQMLAAEDLGFLFSQPVAEPAAIPAVVRATVGRTSKTKEAETSCRKRTKPTAPDKQERQAKKKRKQKDEIDDIFGF